MTLSSSRPVPSWAEEVKDLKLQREGSGGSPKAEGGGTVSSQWEKQGEAGAFPTEDTPSRWGQVAWACPFPGTSAGEQTPPPPPDRP